LRRRRQRGRGSSRPGRAVRTRRRSRSARGRNAARRRRHRPRTIPRARHRQDRAPCRVPARPRPAAHSPIPRRPPPTVTPARPFSARKSHQARKATWRRTLRPRRGGRSDVSPRVGEARWTGRVRQHPGAPCESPRPSRRLLAGLPKRCAGSRRRGSRRGGRPRQGWMRRAAGRGSSPRG